MLAVLFVTVGYAAANHSASVHNVLREEQLSERFVKYLMSYPVVSDTLFEYLCEYCKCYRYEGDAEAISERLYGIFYRNDTIGDYMDTYSNKKNINAQLQDTIRVRTMFFIEGYLNVRGDSMPLPLDAYDDYPYFKSHRAIFNSDSLYLRYFP